MNRRFISLFILSFFLVTGIVHAQAIPTLSSTGLDLTPSSNNPVPGQSVTITARSFSADIDTSQISWVVNGKLAQSGVGSTKFVVKAPSLGKKLNIDVSAVTSTGRKMFTTIVVSSGSIDLITETDGYVHALFLGKIAPVAQNKVTIIAMPHIADASGTEYDPKNLVYQWKKNDRVLEDQSGYGKQSVSIKGDVLPRAYTLDVTAWPRDNSTQAETQITISYQPPTAQFYVDDSLYGMFFNRSVKNSITIGSSRESGVRVIPYGFNKSPIDSTLSYNWLINGTEHPELLSSESIVLRAPADLSGSSNVSLDIQNSKEILQSVSADFSVKFKKDAGTSNNPVTF